MKYRKVTPEELAEWSDMRQAGKTFREIGEQAKRDHKVVYHALRRAGIKGYAGTGHFSYPVGWCNECCDYKPIDVRTGWCARHTASLSRRRSFSPPFPGTVVGQYEA